MADIFKKLTYKKDKSPYFVCDMYNKWDCPNHAKIYKRLIKKQNIKRARKLLKRMED